MLQARYRLVDTQTTPYYHCISRCVRRAFLCGRDRFSGKIFDHRKQWLVTHIKQLAAHFSMEICAYAVMSNHYHLVLYVNQAQAEAWTDNEVIECWTAVFPRNGALIETLLKNKTTDIQPELPLHRMLMLLAYLQWSNRTPSQLW